MTIIGNPGYTLDTLLESKKLIDLHQVLVPFCFLPARRAAADVSEARVAGDVHSASTATAPRA